jgi:hypothetical protein
MKLFLIVLGVTIIWISDISAQWVQQIVPDSVTVLNTVNFTNTNTGVCTGWDFGASFITSGRAIYTTNSGINWLAGTVPYTCRVIASAKYINAVTLYGTGAMNLSLDGPYPKPNISELDIMGRIKNSYFEKNPAAGNNSVGAFFRSTDGGLNWLKYGTLPSDCSYLTYMDFINANTGVVIADIGPTGTNYVNIYKTTNGGTSWAPLLTPHVNGQLEALKFVNENLIFAAGFDSINGSSRSVLLKSTNGGINWIRQAFDTCYFKAINFINNTTGFISGGSEPYGKVFKTTDQGSTWNTVLTTMDSVIMTGVNFYGETGVGIAFGNKNTKGGLYTPYAFRTSNFGLTWSTQTLSVTYDPLLISSCILDRYNYYISGASFSAVGNIFHTINGGSVGVNSNSGITLENFSLEQNYPNPFNPYTTIKFNVPSKSQIILNVYDITGKQISSLLNEIKPQGSYEVKFDGINLPSGIYYYKLISGDFTETKKMILIK